MRDFADGSEKVGKERQRAFFCVKMNNERREIKDVFLLSSLRAWTGVLPRSVRAKHFFCAARKNTAFIDKKAGKILAVLGFLLPVC